MKIEKHFDLREVADIVKMSVDAIRTQIREGKLAFIRIGTPRHGRIRISESDLQAFLERNRIAALGEKIGSAPKQTGVKNGS
jgi:excisionase family DNA binding protein